ncbi:MAG TPA: TonB-dependent receptor [Lentimicrobium sp.]|nr:TonB-dependent receptor [Lentimicrobium sp.]
MTKYTASLAAFLALFIINSSLGQHAIHGSIKGRIFEANSNEPVPFANVIIYETTVGVTSDLEGNFTINNIHPGYIRIAASSVGYEPYISEEFEVTNNKVVFLEIPLVKANIELEQIVVTATPFKRTPESPVSMRTLGIKQLERNPGGNRDVSKVMQSLPGVVSTVSFRNDVIVRGGGPSENRFYLDGMEIPNLNHFATQGASGGPIGLINIDFIREIDFYSGAFPANRGNALSSVLEMKQIDGNEDNLVIKGAFGASDLSLALNGPINNKTTFLFSARRSYLKFLFDIIGLPFLPIYNDFQFKIKTRFDQKNELTILGIGAIDQMKLNTSIEDPDENQQYLLDYLPVYNQWNYAMGAVYKHFRKNSYDTWVFSRNMLNNESYKHEDNDESKPLISDYISQEIENKLRYENSGIFKGYKLITGAGIEYAKYNTSTFQKTFIPMPEDTIRALDFNSEFDLFKWNLFGQVSKEYLNKRLTVSLGIRADANNYSEKFTRIINNISPRISAAYGFTEKWYLNMNLGRFLQQPAYTTLGYRSNDGVLVNEKNGLEFIKSDHAVLGLEYRKSNNTRYTIEGFYKLYTDYPVSVVDSISLANKGGDYGVVGNEEVTSTGEGRTFGVELFIQEKLFNNYDFIASYTLVKSEFKDKNEKFIPSAWDNGHILNITLSREFENEWYVGLRWRFVGGTPFTPYDLYRSSLIEAYSAQPKGYLDYTRFNTERLDSFHQLDIRIDKQFYFNKWSLTLYTDIQNAYNYKSDEPPFIVAVTDSNGEKLRVEGDPTRYQLKEISSPAGTVLPTIGIIVEF